MSLEKKIKGLQAFPNTCYPIRLKTEGVFIFTMYKTGFIKIQMDL